MSWSCPPIYLLIGLLVCLLLGSAAAQEAAPAGTTPSSLLLKQSQNTFVQWVLSLLPQRPGAALETVTLTTLSSSATSPTEAPTDATVATSSTTSTTSTPAPTLSTTTTRRTTTSAPPTLNPPRNCSDCVCGVANIQKRIVGGQETEVHQYPWVAMLLYGGRFYCAGSLLNDQFLLTASHCVYGFRKERISVRLLEHDRKMSHLQKIDRKVAEVITHPKYNARNYDNDIAIIKLDEPVEFNEVLHPVCMPTPGRSFKGETGIVTGWGALKVGGPTSDTLQVGTAGSRLRITH